MGDQAERSTFHCVLCKGDVVVGAPGETLTWDPPWGQQYGGECACGRLWAYGQDRDAVVQRLSNQVDAAEMVQDMREAAHVANETVHEGFLGFDAHFKQSRLDNGTPKMPYYDLPTAFALDDLQQALSLQSTDPRCRIFLREEGYWYWDDARLLDEMELDYGDRGRWLIHYLEDGYSFLTPGNSHPFKINIRKDMSWDVEALNRGQWEKEVDYGA